MLRKLKNLFHRVANPNEKPEERATDAETPAPVAGDPGTDVVLHPRSELIPEIRATPLPEDVPEFKRCYNVMLPNGIAMQVEYRTTYGKRNSIGMLRQPGGAYVAFDPDRVADRIFDRELVPLIERRVAEAKALDLAFVASQPKEFIDGLGQTWRLV
jgi:hypothetical protein